VKRFAILAAIILAVDQLTKYLILRELKEIGDYYRLIGNFVRITHVENPFGVFGISFGGRIPLLPLTVFAIIVLVIIAWRHKNFPVAFSLILGGAVGNALDRVRLEKVVDFLDIGITENLRWPVFNVADLAITTGIVILIIKILIRPKPLE